MKTEIQKYIKNPITILVIIGIIVGGYFVIKSFYPAVKGETFYLSNGDFSMFFPEQPTYSLTPQELTKGNKINVHSYTLGIGNLNSSLSVGYVKSPFAGSSLTPEENLQRELEWTANTGGSRLISSKLSTYKGYPSIDYVVYNQIDKTLPPVYGAGRDVLKDGDLYMLGYGYAQQEENKNIQNKFLNSLTFGRAWSSKDVNSVGNTFYTKSDNTNVRECASTSCKVVATYPANTSVYLQYSSEDELPDWVEVTWQDDGGATQKGYVSKTTLVRKALTDVYTEGTTSNGTLCNSVYWDKCPAGQDFICPANGGEAYCQAQGGGNGADITRKNDLPTIIKEWNSNVALIVCSYTSTGDIGFGSGFLTKFSDGSVVVVTNKHVITDAYGYSADKCAVQIPGDGNNYYTVSGSEFKVSSLGYDWGSIPITNGSAYLNNSANKNLPACQQAADTGDNVVILGYPSYAGSFTNPTATQGIISGYGEPYYTTSAKIEQGNSGGVAIQPERDCYLGIPSAVKLGTYENLGRILNANKVFQLGY